MFSKGFVQAFVQQVLDVVPARTDAGLKTFVSRLKPITAGVPDAEEMLRPQLDDLTAKCYLVQDWFFCLRRFEDRNIKQNFLEVWPGTGGRYWGYLRLNPNAYDDEGKGRKIWEISHAFSYTKVRGQGINRLYIELSLALARANRADLIVANPRHVSMLVGLTDYGFRIKGGSGSAQSIKRIIRQGRNWYGKNTNARRLYYGQELRSFMQDGSMMMEKDLARERFWTLKLF
jgi:hypothetical protein